MEQSRRPQLWTAVLFVAIAATVWGLDGVVREKVSDQASSTQIVFLETLIGWFAMFPIILHRRKRFVENWKKVGRQDFLHFLIAALLGSLMGSLCFTRAIQELGTNSAIWFQVIQPFVVVVLAVKFLKEKPSKFVAWVGIWILANAFLIASPTLIAAADPDSVGGRMSVMGIVYGLGAMVFWGFSTVSGKYLCTRLSPDFVVFGRWGIASIIFGIALAVQGEATHLLSLDFMRENWAELLLIGAVLGSFPYLSYYSGLRYLPASVATFVELLYVVVTIGVSAAASGAEIHILQLVGAFSILVAVGLYVRSEINQ